MATTILVSGVQYSGIWNLSSQANAKAAGTWPPAYNSTSLYGFGSNAQGQLGLGNVTSYSSPKQIGASSTWSTVSSGLDFTIAVKADGTLWAWGSGTSGRLGLGNATSYSSPKQIGALTAWSKVVCGDDFSIAIKTNGTLWAWGKNAQGQLGDGTTTVRSSPVQIGALTTWLNIASGYAATIATKTDGTMWSWGAGGYGQLGLGNVTYYSSPKQIGALTNWSSGSIGGRYFSSAVKTDGTLWAWGDATYGQLGQGNTTNTSSPVQIGALTTWSKASNGSSAMLAIKTDNSLWAWGRGLSFGQLGLGNTTDYYSPKQVGSLYNWLSISCGKYQSFSTKTDGTLWAWGRNNAGQLGLGNTTNYSSPKQIGASTAWLKIAAGYQQTFGIQ